jgi:imidazolonepropionase-like amidohydrolase
LKDESMSRIVFYNASLFDGHTPHLRENHSVVVEDSRIVEVREGKASVSGDEMLDVGGRTLMPGLIDLHTHPCLNDVVAARAFTTRTEIVALHAARVLRRSLMAGFTTLRDAGGTDPIYLKAMQMDLLEGPRLYPAGRFITMTGGHGDMRDPDSPGIRSCCGIVQDRFAAVADGPEEVRKAVREELRRGARQIKLFVSGGAMSPTGSVDQLQYTEEEIRSAVETAEAQRSYVMAHCHPDGAIERASKCGVRSVEHCSFITEKTALKLVERGTYAVPTMAVLKGLQEEMEALGLPQVSREKMRGAWEPMLRSMEILKRTGVKVGLGSDVCGQLSARQCSEFTLRAEIFSSYEILVSATSMAAEILRETDRLGVVAPGAHADLIVVDADPLKDIRVLDRGGANLPVIMKAGHFHKRAI